MTSRLALAVAFFIVWLVILLAGADRPPPPGFVWVVLLDAAAAGIVYWRTARYMGWCATGRNPLLRVVGEGFCVGIMVAGLVILFNPTGEIGVAPPAWSDRGLWFAVLGVAGAVNALLVFGGSCLIRRLAAGR